MPPISPRWRTPASRGRWWPPRCTTGDWGAPKSRQLRRERMLDLIALGDHLADLRLALDGPPDGFLGGAIVEVLDLLVVGRIPMDEHADATEQVLGLVLRDDAFGHAVGDRLGDRVLGRAEHLHR